MKTFFSFATFLGMALCFPAMAEDAEQEGSLAGLPAAYAKNYLVAASTMSPDKKFAIIYPTADNDEFPEGKDQVVSLKPFAILGALDTKWPYFKNQSHGGLSAEWSKDGSVALVTIESKWGPGDIFVVELKDGKVTRTTNLATKVSDLLRPDYRKAMSESFNDNFDFVFATEDESSWKLDGAGHVLINAMASSDPKATPGRKSWEGRAVATWDIAQAKFTSQKVTRVFAGVRKDDE